MNSFSHQLRAAKTGFTLVEVLVSITVLGLMMLGVSQMLNGAVGATLGAYKHLDADTQARLVLDRIAYDVSKMTKRNDVDYYFQKNAASGGASTFYGNDQMAFYSESEGYYPSSVTPTTQEGNVSLVGYMINSNNQLVRLCRGLTWSGVNTGVTTSVVYNPVANSPTYSSVTSNTISGNSATSGYNASTWPLVATGNDPYYQVIGDQVFRLEYTFLVQSSRTSATSGQTTAYYSDSPWNTTDSTPNGLQDVTAVVVTIAVLDTKSRAMVSATALQTAAADLPDSAFTTPTAATTATSLPLPNWEAALAANNLGLPQAVASQVRFYQRFCYLNHLQ